MRIKTNKKILLEILSKIQGLTGRKSSLAITENVLITAYDSFFNLVVTDLETGFEGIFPADVEKEGSVVINAKKLYEIIKNFPEEHIIITEKENHWIKIGEKNVIYHLVGMKKEDFPLIPQFDEIEFFKLDSYAFKKMIERTIIISGSGDEKRSHIKGFNFEFINDDEKIIRMVSTDGGRLSKVDYIFSEEKNVVFPSIKNVIIPKKGMNEVIKFLDTEGEIQLGFKENHCIIKNNNLTLIIRLLEGYFPEYKDIIIKDNFNILELDKQMFLMMLKRMSILSNEDYKSVIFNIKEKKLTITSSNPELGESQEEMKINFKGKPFEGAFNPRFFIESISAVDEEKIFLYFIDEEHPCLIEGKNNSNYLTVIMPMRI